MTAEPSTNIIFIIILLQTLRNCEVGLLVECLFCAGIESFHDYVTAAMLKRQNNGIMFPPGTCFYTYVKTYHGSNNATVTWSCKVFTNK